ncbi:hypothetical protein [Micromonospora sp. ALFpr18c]|uniref:hypothetical protein n=1 Tax=Micromonospora sp. ALFpr18c TaxID=1458665 RepID=UPI001CEC02B3|nr:hypothetical protein [Micromonospora sp. ALFpr18c]
MPLQHRGHAYRLAAGERPRILTDDDRVEAPVRVGHRGEQRCGLRPVDPGQFAGVADVKELRDDPAPAGDEFTCDVELPAPRGHRVLRGWFAVN